MQQNKDITDSINYASRIQTSMLASNYVIDRIFNDSLLLFLPRDIVSGDFYWVAAPHELETENGVQQTVVAAVDCTGHGVPGAFLTIVANNLLNQIVKEKGITQPSEILTRLNDQLISRFQNKSDKEMADGMDIALCNIRESIHGIKIEFAGAYNPLFLIRNGELHEIKGTRASIGSRINEGNEIIFDEYTFEGEVGDYLYMFSDGYVDQLGGPKGKKFMKKPFKKLLLDIYKKPMKEQEKILKEKLEEWQGETVQVDDILVLGLKL
ncbi:MAG: PP2C family protein-serine/threonine phosphatase [Flavobacteriales bacterium]